MSARFFNYKTIIVPNMKFGRGYESNEVEREKTHAGIYLIIKF